jgi:Transcriptional regulator
MDLHYLKVFHTVAKYSSFKKASEVLHISQPALSVQIKKLENQSSVILFNRIGNKVYLSENGSILYSYTKRIFSLVDEMEHMIMNQTDIVGGTINLGGSNTPGTYILPSVIGEMKRLYPDATINLHIANTSEITTLVENGTLDIAINGGECNYSKNIIEEKLFDDRLIIAASPKNSMSEKEYVTIAELSDENFIVHEKTSQLYSCFKEFIDDFNIPENICMYLGNIDAIKHAIMVNLGISIIPYYAVKFEIEVGLIKELKLNHNVTNYPYKLIYNKNKNISLTARKFMEILRNMYGSQKEEKK